MIKSWSPPLFKNNNKKYSAAEILAPIGYWVLEHTSALNPITSVALDKLGVYFLFLQRRSTVYSPAFA